ncbi:MAG: ionic transporter y4hA [Burkholderiales bacterium]|nr:ionic transporter y4hA [Burkholderiales bacterium]
MASTSDNMLPPWTIAIPVISCAILASSLLVGSGGLVLGLVGLALVAAVITAVHHAEVVAHRVGEPFGTLILALAVTVIEVALVVSMMLSGGAGAATVVRDTVYAAIMIVCNGVVGLCLVVGGIRHHVLHFRVDATGPTISVLAALATLTLILPNFTTSTSGPTFSPSQLAFAGLASLALYGAFVFVQTVRHRDYFLPVETEPREAHVVPPRTAVALTSLALLVVCLLAVVGLAKTLAPSIRNGVEAAGAPLAVVGIIIALLVLMPETWAAVRAAARNRMQVSLNLALGSGLATIGLTIPVIAALSLPLDLPLSLGLPGKETVLLALTLLVSAVTLGSGRATVLQGAVHLVLFAAFLFLAVVP